MKRRYQTWYADEVQKQLNDNVPVEQVKVEMPASIITHENANWMISAWLALQQHSEMAINGFRKQAYNMLSIRSLAKNVLYMALQLALYSLLYYITIPISKVLHSNCFKFGCNGPHSSKYD